MNKKSIITISAIVLLLVTVITTVAFGNDSLSSMGKSLFNAKSGKSSDEVIAEYKGEVITRGEVEYQHNLSTLSTSNKDLDSRNESDLDIAKRLISGLILLEEAERKGLSATEDEVSEMVSDIKKNYYNIPEITEQVDEYCKSAGITVDEYFTVVEEQAPSMLSRQKLKNNFADEYYKTHTLEDGSFPPDIREKMEKAYEEYRNDLLNENKESIIYYTD